MPTAPAQQPKQDQAPFGVSPATQPVPNRGYEAAAASRLGLVVNQLTDLLKLAGASSDIGKAVLDALKTLTKHVPPGSVTPAAEKANIDRMAMQNNQNNSQMQALRQRQAQPQGGGASMPQGGTQMPSPAA